VKTEENIAKTEETMQIKAEMCRSNFTLVSKNRWVLFVSGNTVLPKYVYSQCLPV